MQRRYATRRFERAAPAAKQFLALRAPTLRRRWWTWRKILMSPKFVAGPQGFRAYCRLLYPSPEARSSTIRIPLRTLNGHAILARSGTSDAQVIYDTFVGKYHLPPVEVQKPVQIVDLGANIGTTMAHLAVLYPEAQILGVELDDENVSLCQSNIAPWSERCAVLHAAIWPEDGTTRYRLEHGNEYGARVVMDTSSSHIVKAISLNSILAQLGRDIDYLKMDIEGAEQGVLRAHNEWAERVRAINVEVHPPYSLEACLRDLRALDFEARTMPSHLACAVGFRRSPEPTS